MLKYNLDVLQLMFPWHHPLSLNLMDKRRLNLSYA